MDRTASKTLPAFDLGSEATDVAQIDGSETYVRYIATPTRRCHYLAITHMDNATEPRIVIPRRERVTIGRAPDNEIVLNDQYVSAHHAVLTLIERPEITDLGSHNALFINGVRVARGSLRSGDTVQVGRHLIGVTPYAPRVAESAAKHYIAQALESAKQNGSVLSILFGRLHGTLTDENDLACILNENLKGSDQVLYLHECLYVLLWNTPREGAQVVARKLAARLEEKLGKCYNLKVESVTCGPNQRMEGSGLLHLESLGANAVNKNQEGDVSTLGSSAGERNAAGAAGGNRAGALRYGLSPMVVVAYLLRPLTNWLYRRVGPDPVRYQ